jgi:hypothetical protein
VVFYVSVDEGRGELSYHQGLRFGGVGRFRFVVIFLVGCMFGATSFPFILMSKDKRGKIRGFQCTPAKLSNVVLLDAVNEELGNEKSLVMMVTITTFSCRQAMTREKNCPDYESRMFVSYYRQMHTQALDVARALKSSSSESSSGKGNTSLRE